jgi:hypothetical protein
MSSTTLPAAPQAVSNLRLAAHRFIVNPLERLRFAVGFVLATGLGAAAVKLVLHLLQQPAVSLHWQQSGLLEAFVTGFVSGTFVGTSQWLALRRYIPDWFWVLASTAGYVILMPILQAWQPILLDRVLPQLERQPWFNQLPPGLTAVLPLAIGVGLSAICTIWLGVAQWCVLRQYARSSWVWLYVPSAAVLASGGVMLLRLLLPAVEQVFAIDVLAACVFGSIPAITLCGLEKRAVAPEIHRSSPLAVAPEIIDRGLIRRLSRQLYGQINHLWLSEQISDRPLRYLVGMNQAGTIVDYEPEHLLAADYVEATPLPDLADASSYIDSVGNSQPLARFQVLFLPSGRLQVRSWRGLSLKWLSLMVLGSVLGLSAIVAYGSSYWGSHLPGAG